MAIQRDKDGKFSGSGTQSMENFVKMRENPDSLGKQNAFPDKVRSRNSNVTGKDYSGGLKDNRATVDFNTSSLGKEKVSAKDAQDAKKFYRRDARMSKAPSSAKFTPAGPSGLGSKVLKAKK